ncbi:MAG: hypothetical protein V8Q84_01805 [Bilophila sp.]
MIGSMSLAPIRLPKDATKADEDAARADGVHLGHEAIVRAQSEAEQEQEHPHGPCENLIRHADDQRLLAQQKAHGDAEDKAAHFHEHGANSFINAEKLIIISACSIKVNNAKGFPPR